MEDKTQKPRPPRMAADVPRSARIVVNSDKPEARRKIKKESPKNIQSQNNYLKASQIAGHISKDVENELKSQEDGGMATLGYAASAVNNAKKIYDTAHTVNTEIHRTAETIHNGVAKAVATAKAVKEIPEKVKTGEVTVRQIRNHALKSTAKNSAKATSYVAKTSASAVKKIGSYGVNYAVDSMSHSENDATRMMGKTAKTMQYVYRIRQREKRKVYRAKATNPSPKAAGISTRKREKNSNTNSNTNRVSNGASKQKSSYGSKSVKNVQQKKRTAAYRKQWSKSVKGKATTAITKAGGSVSAAMTKAATAAGKDVIVPLVLGVIVVLLVVVIIFAGAAMVTIIFSPFLSDDSGNQVDESAWLTAKITTSRAELIQDIKDTYNDNLVDNGGEYHYVRFYNSITETEVILDDTNIDTSIYTVLEYQQFIQPIFHTLMLSEYELQASESQMTDLYDEIWDKISVIKTEPLPTEYCQMTRTDKDDGTYEINPVKESDENVHADPTTCPNMSEELFHTDDPSQALCSCDSYYYICDGHEGDCTHSCNDDCEGGCDHTCDTSCETSGCSHTCDDSCDEYCGHQHTTWSSASSPGCHETDYHDGNLDADCGNSTKHLACEGYYICYGHKILFLTVELKEFDELLQLYYLNRINELEAKATLTEEEQKELRDLKQYYEVCVEYIAVLVEEFGLGNATIVTLEGVELTPLTAYACKFVGKPYIWGGTNPNNGADCSGFVQYVYAHFGTSLPRVSNEQVREGSTVSSITEAEPGDLIFYSRDGTDSGVYHVAIYLGNNKIVHASNSKPYPSGGIKVSYVYGTIYKIKRI